MSEGIFGYLLESQHGPIYRWTCVALAVGAAVLMGMLLWSSLPAQAHPKPPFVYQYQWTPLWGRWRFETWRC